MYCEAELRCGKVLWGTVKCGKGKAKEHGKGNMGKKGKALREAKLKSTVYTFSKEELLEHDRLVRLESIDACRLAAQEKAAAVIAEEEKKREQFKKAVEAEWEERSKRFCSSDLGSNLVEFTRLAVMIPLKVLVEKFGWKPAPPEDKRDMRYKMSKLHDYIALELNDLVTDDLKDIRRYAEEAEKITGIKFEIIEEMEGEHE